MKNSFIKKLLIMLGISVGSFIGFNVAFMLAALITLSIARFTGPIGNSLGRIVFLVVIYLIFNIFRCKAIKNPNMDKSYCLFNAND